ncbi:integron integrase [compost metagenome]
MGEAFHPFSWLPPLVGDGAAEVEAFLSDLAGRGNVSASTRNQALAALLFLYEQVLKLDLSWLGEVVRAK